MYAYQSTNSSRIWITQTEEGTVVVFIHTFVQHLIKTPDPKSSHILEILIFESPFIIL